VSFFLVEATVRSDVLSGLSEVAQKGTVNVQSALNTTRVFVNAVNSLFTVLDGNVNMTAQYIPFVYADGGFPVFMQRMYYLTNVAPDNINNFTQMMRALPQPEIYANFTILDANLKPIPNSPNSTQSMYLPITHASLLPTAILGYDHYSDPTRKPVIDRALATRATSASAQVLSVNLINNVVIQYSPVYSQKQETLGKLLGIVTPVFFISRVLSTSLVNFGEVYASVVDLNTTDPTAAFMYNSIQDSGVTITAERNRKMIQDSPLYINTTVTFADRTWRITFLPREVFLNMYYNSFNKWIGTIVAIALWVTSFGVCVFLIFFTRLRATAKDREASDNKIRILSKFMPSSFLSMIHAKSMKNLFPGSHRYNRILIMAVSIDNFAEFSEGKNLDGIMAVLNDVYYRLKSAVQKYHGFVHRFEGLSFLVVFTHESIGPSAAQDILNEARHDVQMHIAVHSCNVLSGLMGDSETLLAAIITDQLDVLKKLSILCRLYGSTIAFTENALERVKKNIERTFIYLGRIETLDEGEKIFTEAFQLVDASLIAKTQRRRFGVVLKKQVTEDYLGALEMLQALVEIEDAKDSRIVQLHATLSGTVNLCLKLSEVWTLAETLSFEKLRIAFELFCSTDSSNSALRAWHDMREYRGLPSSLRPQAATDIFMRYCSNTPTKLNDTIVQILLSKMDLEQYPLDLFDDVTVELERISIEAHFRFTKTPMFLNAMYSLMKEKP
jgi:class 3 adenylate cyclase